MAISWNPESWINWPMAKEPLNWVIVGVIASIWLFAFHAVMTGFGAMAGGGTGQAIGGGGPGTVAAPAAPGTVGMFAMPGSQGGGPLFDGNQWWGTAATWTDDFDSRYAEDGWLSL